VRIAAVLKCGRKFCQKNLKSENDNFKNSVCHKSTIRHRTDKAVLTKIGCYDNLTVSKEKKKEDAASKECLTASLINPCSDENTVTCIHLRHENVHNNPHV